jgi:hypothetical protein
MDAMIGRRLVKVVRLAWRRPGEPDQFNVGPVQLVFDDGGGLLLDGHSDWTLSLTETYPGDESWLGLYDYDCDGGRWWPRDASAEPPFSSVIARPLVYVEQTRNEVDEVTGLTLDFEGNLVTLGIWQGEIRS